MGNDPTGLYYIKWFKRGRHMVNPGATSDQLPNIFQANLLRFYERVIKATLAGLTVHAKVEAGETTSLDTFLDRAAAQVDNYTANEAAKAFTLVVSGLFERQLRIWAARIFPAEAEKVQFESFKVLATRCAQHAGFDIQDLQMASDLEEAFQVANVVRHGDGKALKYLQSSYPALFDPSSDYLDLLTKPSPASEQMRIKPSDVRRYVLAGLRYWGHANSVPFAQLDPAI